jgi:putative PIN family toxin of toxin-antitoxin system
MNYVLDTSVLVAGIRSPNGASAEILRKTLVKDITVLCSVPLFLEYEEVLLRPEHLSAARVSEKDLLNFLDVLAGAIYEVEIQYLWRPCLRDPDDDMVLEIAVNGLRLGDQVTIVTFNQRDFLPHASRLGVEIISPSLFFKGA